MDKIPHFLRLKFNSICTSLLFLQKQSKNSVWFKQKLCKEFHKEMLETHVTKHLSWTIKYHYQHKVITNLYPSSASTWNHLEVEFLWVGLIGDYFSSAEHLISACVLPLSLMLLEPWKKPQLTTQTDAYTYSWP